MYYYFLGNHSRKISACDGPRWHPGSPAPLSLIPRNAAYGRLKSVDTGTILLLSVESPNSCALTRPGFFRGDCQVVSWLFFIGNDWTGRSLSRKSSFGWLFYFIAYKPYMYWFGECIDSRTYKRSRGSLAILSVLCVTTSVPFWSAESPRMLSPIISQISE